MTPRSGAQVSAVPRTLAAQMTRVIALMALATLELTGVPVHEPIHGQGAQTLPLCYCT